MMTEDTEGPARGPWWRRVCGDLGCALGGSVANGCRQAGSGMARSRARARPNFSCHGQLCGRCRVRRRAERVIRPAREKNRRRRVLVVATCSPRAMRAVQRARLCAITCIANQAPLAAKRPRRKMVQPHAVLQVPDGVLDLGVTAVIGLQLQGLPVPVGDEAVITVGGEEGQLGTRRGLDPPDRRQLFLPVALPQGICYRSGAIASRRCYRNQVVAS